MTELARDLDKGSSTPRYIIRFYEEGERIASFAERNPIPIPDRGDTIRLEAGDVQESGEIQYDSVGKFRVDEIHYAYTLIRNVERLEEDADSAPDQLAAFVAIDVSREDEAET